MRFGKQANGFESHPSPHVLLSRRIVLPSRSLRQRHFGNTPGQSTVAYPTHDTGSVPPLHRLLSPSEQSGKWHLASGCLLETADTLAIHVPFLPNPGALITTIMMIHIIMLVLLIIILLLLLLLLLIIIMIKIRIIIWRPAFFVEVVCDAELARKREAGRGWQRGARLRTSITSLTIVLL